MLLNAPASHHPDNPGIVVKDASLDSILLPDDDSGCHKATRPSPNDIGRPGLTNMTLIQLTVNAVANGVGALPSVPAAHANHVPAVAGVGT